MKNCNVKGKIIIDYLKENNFHKENSLKQFCHSCYVYLCMHNQMVALKVIGGH